MLIHNAEVTGSLLVNGIPYNTGSFSGSFLGTISTASYVEYNNVANKPALLSGSAQVAAFGFATTGSNQFNGNQTVTGSLTVTGQVIAQTLNVQQVTSSIIYSSGSNVFGNSLANTQQLTGSVSVTGSLSVNNTPAILGSGTTNYLAKFTAGSTVGDSAIFESGGNVGIGTAAPDNITNYTTLDVRGVTGGIIQSSNGSQKVRLYTTGVGAFLGTSSNDFLQIITNDTERMRITSGGNVGIGTITPTGNLEIFNNNIGGNLRLSRDAGVQRGLLEWGRNNGGSFQSIASIVAESDLTSPNNGLLRFITSNSSGTQVDRMRITSVGNVGIGTSSPTGTYGKLTVAGGIHITNDNNAKLEIGRYSVGVPNSYIKLGTSSNSLRFTNNADLADLMELTNSGNLGLGVTPSAWDTYKAFQISEQGSLASVSTVVNLSQNAFWNGSGHTRIVTGTAAQYHINDGVHAWRTAPSGTAGNAISFTQAMTLFSDGNLLLTNGAISNAGFKLDVNGTGRFSGALAVQNSRLGLGIRSSDRGELFLNSVGTDDVSDLFFGFGNGYTQEGNIRWVLSDRGTTSGDLVFFTGPANGGFLNVLSLNKSGAATFSSSVRATAFIKTGIGEWGTFNSAASGASSASYYQNYGTDSSSSVIRWYVGQNAFRTDGSFAIQNTVGTGLYLTTGNTSWTSTSDERSKDIIRPITNALNDINSWRTVVGKYKNDEIGKERLFLIAQDILVTTPQVVDVSDEGNLGLRYLELIPVLVKAIQELNEKIK